MKFFRSLFIVALLLLPSAVLAQGYSKVQTPWYQQGKIAAGVAVTTNSAATQLPSAGLIAAICNTGGSDVYLSFGADNTVAATVAGSTWLRAGRCATYDLNPFSTRFTWMAAIASGGSTTLTVETGIGNYPIAANSVNSVPIQQFASIPTAIGWDSTNYPITPSIIYSSGNPAIGSAGVTAEALFDRFSTARSAPGTITYTKATGGSDSNSCLTGLLSCTTIGRAQTVCNTAGLPCTIFIDGCSGQYYKSQSFTNFGSVFPSVDTAYIATCGTRVNVCHCDAYSAPSKDATFTNTYSFVLGAVERVFDTTRRDQFGDYVELMNVASNAIANVTPNSWALTGGSIYIQRYDGSAVTNANTRIMRSSGGANVYLNTSTQISVYMGGATGADGFDVEGGSDGIKTNFTIKPAGLKAIVTNNVSFKYAGGIVTTAGNGTTINSLNGIAAFYNTQASANAADGFNTHNSVALTGGTAAQSVLTVNATGFDNGRGVSQSANCLTVHEDVKMMDIAAWCWGNHGGSVRNIASSVAYLLGTIVQMDQGDQYAGGTNPSTAYRVDNTSVMYLESVQMQMPSATYGLYATSGATMMVRNSAIGRQPNAGAGTFGTF